MMIELIQVLTFPALLVALAVVSQLFGVDSRDGGDAQPPDVFPHPRAHV